MSPLLQNAYVPIINFCSSTKKNKRNRKIEGNIYDHHLLPGQPCFWVVSDLGEQNQHAVMQSHTSGSDFKF